MNSNHANNPFDLHGTNVLVTGASSGLGRHFARTLAAAGASVAVAARRTERLTELVDELRARGGRAHAVALDVTSRQSVVSCIGEAAEVLGDLQVLVNNAGVSDTKAVLDYVDEDWDAILDTNLKGAWMMAQEMARHMRQQAMHGSIVNVTSILANRVTAGVGPYAVAKAGLAQLTRSMALELARHQIRVNAIAPGYVITELNEAFLHSPAGEKLRQRIPSRQFCQYQDLDGALLLLASSASRMMTGSEIVVDGGHLCSGL